MCFTSQDGRIAASEAVRFLVISLKHSYGRVNPTESDFSGLKNTAKI